MATAQPSDKEDDDKETSDISVVSLVYAEAVAAGLEDEQVVREVFAALVAKADYQVLKRLYASVVRKNRERQSIVRRSLRETGYRQEVWAEWPSQKVNALYAMAIASGAEPDPVLRQRLFRLLDREADDAGPDILCDASCGPEDPEHPFNIYDTDIFREWLGWYEHVFHGGPAPAVLFEIDAAQIEKLIDGSCTIAQAVSAIGTVADVIEIVRNDPPAGLFWKRRS
ncbi:MAG: hypothetical protein OXU63_09820 [Acidobacteriota bacterium]|nr:hypothetical protein [Acidobacteriota bacterium]